jgi:hypothetical protein
VARGFSWERGFGDALDGRDPLMGAVAIGQMSSTREDAPDVERVMHAAAAVRLAKASRDAEAVAAAERELRVVVQTACDFGVSWQTIGDVLGMRRGNAYQRFRRRPRTAEADSFARSPL